MSARTWTHPRRVLGWAFIALLVLFAVSIAVSLVVFVLRGSSTGYVFFPFFPFGFWWIFFLFFIFWGFRWWAGWGWYGRPYWRYHDDAHAILRSRYARGEITREQFEQMMRDLEQHV